jgi:hypothetical protein
MASQPEPTVPHAGIDEQSIRVAAYRGGLFVALAAVAISIVLAPFAVTSLLAAFRQPVGNRAYNLMTPKLHGEWTKLNVAAISINEAAQVVTFRVSGFHNCPSKCTEVERVQFFSVRADPNGAVGAPPFAAVDLPPDSSEIDQQFTLPITGDLLDYPFDRYSILLGTTFSYVTKAGATIAFSPSATRSGLDFSVNSDIPRITMAAPKLLRTGQYDTAGVTYDSVAALDLYRPAYLRILTVLLTLLIVLAAAYGVLFRPFTQIVPTVGASVLGVWGVRSLLVGSYPPDSTGVDLVLESAILLLLLIIAFRAVVYMWPRSELGRRRAPTGRAETEASS